MRGNFKILDMRCRPPYGNFMYSGPKLYFGLYDPATLPDFHRVCGSPYPESAKERSLPLFFKEMDESGIDIGLLPIRAVTGSANEEIIPFMDKHPGKFIAVAGVDPNKGIQEAIDAIDKWAVKGPFVGISMEPILDDPVWMPDNKEMMYPIYDYMQKNDIPLMLTTGDYTMFGFEMLTAINNACLAFPKLNFIVAHGCWPFANVVCAMATTLRNLYVSPDLYMVNSESVKTYVDAANCSCKDRILFGSAYPGCDMKFAVDSYLSALRPEVAAGVLYGNAAEALHL